MLGLLKRDLITIDRKEYYEAIEQAKKIGYEQGYSKGKDKGYKLGKYELGDQMMKLNESLIKILMDVYDSIKVYDDDVLFMEKYKYESSYTNSTNQSNIIDFKDLECFRFSLNSFGYQTIKDKRIIEDIKNMLDRCRV